MFNLVWVAPDACTLPTADKPVRVAEFDALWAQSLARVVLVSDTHARLELAGPDRVGLAARARDLIARETACCSFFQFNVQTSNVATVTMEIRVPTARKDVLAALVRRAETLRGRAR